MSDEFAEIEEDIKQRDINLRLMRQLAAAKAKTEDLVDAVYQGARDAYLTLARPPVVPPARDKRRGRPEVALWHMTDWQGAKLTPSYNSDIMRERVLRFCEKAAKITDIQRADHPVKDATLLFTGDLVEGLWNFPTQAHEVDATIFMQFVNVSELLIDVVRYALSIYEKVTVVAEWGNHGRMGSKRDGIPRPDNLDRMCYEHARRMLSSEKRLTWADCPDDIQRIEIGNYRAIAIHGDEVGRNGFASHTSIVAHVTRWQSGSYPWAFQDVYMGHYHSHLELPLPNGSGSVYQAGSTESENRYAGVMLAATSTPSQRLHFIDPDKGRVTATYKVWLDE